MESPCVSLGLCCINNTLRGKGNKGVFCSRSMIQKNFTIKKAQEYSLKNIADISKLAEWNYKNNIFHLRLSSDILPHFTNPNVEKYDLVFAQDAFREAGENINNELLFIQDNFVSLEHLIKMYLKKQYWI